MDLDWVAMDACTLPTVERPLRLAEFDALFAGYLTSVESSGAESVRMVFEGPIGLQAMVRDLTDREAGCCSFFGFTVSAVGVDQGREVVTLDVEVPRARTNVLDALVAQARSQARVKFA